MADYTEEIATALELIEEFGAACVWTSFAVAAASVGTPHIPGTITPTANNVFIAIFPFDDQIRQTFDLRNAEIPKGTEYGLMGQVSFNPAVADEITKPDGSVVKVEAIKELNPDGLGVILYTVLLSL